MYINNPYFNDDNLDVLYHFGMSTKTDDFHQVFGDVKFVCCGGSARRMELIANMLLKEFDPSSTAAVNLSRSDRYVMFKAGPVLCVNHGMGMPSMSIMLHELFKLLRHARCKDVMLFRIGTSGGIGIPPGTVVVTEQAYNALLEPVYRSECVGKTVTHPTLLDADLCEELYQHAAALGIPVTKGKTVGTNDFYEGQGRLDGALCSYTEKEKLTFLEKARSLGIKNFEMEAPAFAAMTARVGIKAAVLCVTLVNRLEGDQVLAPVATLKGYEERPCQIMTAFIKRRLQQETNGVNGYSNGVNGCANGGGC